MEQIKIPKLGIKPKKRNLTKDLNYQDEISDTDSIESDLSIDMRLLER